MSQQLLDNNSNLIGMTDPNNNDSRNQYDPFNRLAENTHRLDGVTRYEYDLLDLLTKVTAANGVITEYKNDLIGRRIKANIKGSASLISNIKGSASLISNIKGSASLILTSSTLFWSFKLADPNAATSGASSI